MKERYPEAKKKSLEWRRKEVSVGDRVESEVGTNKKRVLLVLQKSMTAKKVETTNGIEIRILQQIIKSHFKVDVETQRHECLLGQLNGYMSRNNFSLFLYMDHLTSSFDSQSLSFLKNNKYEEKKILPATLNCTIYLIW